MRRISIGASCSVIAAGYGEAQGEEEPAMAESEVSVVHATDRSMPEEVTPGMERQQAWADGRVWVGTVRTQPGVATGWHHHGDYESWIHVISGHARMEFGPGGRSVEVARAGDLIHVPPGIVHRELTEGDQPVEAVLFRVGTGPVTFNTEGPSPD
jgi:uncharacterized RmlC-like cupin family protein